MKLYNNCARCSDPSVICLCPLLAIALHSAVIVFHSISIEFFIGQVEEISIRIKFNFKSLTNGPFLVLAQTSKCKFIDTVIRKQRKLLPQRKFDVPHSRGDHIESRPQDSHDQVNSNYAREQGKLPNKFQPLHELSTLSNHI